MYQNSEYNYQELIESGDFTAKTSVSVGIPVLNDDESLEEIVLKSIRLLQNKCSRFEIVIINDGSTDNTGKIADELSLKYPFVKAIHHQQNMGYGYTIREIIQNCECEWICLIDGDGEFDIYDLRKFFKVLPHYDLINSFRYVKLYSGFRKLLSYVFKSALQLFFEARFRDVSSGLRMVRRDVVKDIKLTSSSPFIGAEIAIKIMIRGYRIGELGIQTYPRKGISYSTTPRNILKTIHDMRHVYNEIFTQSHGVEPENE